MGKITTHQSGKACKKDDVFVRKGKNYDYSVHRKEGYQYTRSEEQRTMRSDFGKKSHAVAVWMKANEEHPSPEYKKALKAFKRDKFHNTFRGHVIAFAEKYGITY